MKKRLLIFIGIAFFHQTQAQKIDSIFVNLYTDSLKKGTYNYINIDGRLTNGRFLPLDSTQLVFRSSGGQFFGNSLFLPADFSEDRVHIHVELRNSKQAKDFILFVKKAADPARLPSEEEVMRSRKKDPSSRPRKNP